ncbi:MAG: hypothetical protein IPK00_13690 [Deltaproteobacteria bacterium]|nr:hypothetical protein [Deltaproteobacteria bacterium]
MSGTPTPPSAPWPSAHIDAVARLRAIAAARPHLAYRERTVAAPFELVWSIFGDLEHAVPEFDRYVRWIRITARDGERLALESGGPVPGLRMRFEAIHRPGFCVMRAFAAEVGMAASPIGPAATRIAHFEGSRFLGPVGRWLFLRTIGGELETVARLCEARSEATARDAAATGAG